MPAPFGSYFTPAPGGATGTTTQAGGRGVSGSGVKKEPGGPKMTSADVAGAVLPRGKKTPQQQPKAPPQPKPRPFSMNNPMQSTQPPPMPHPGVIPPYPDARSKSATLMPDGTPVMPPPRLPQQMPKVPPTFAPAAVPQFPGPTHFGMTGLLRR